LRVITGSATAEEADENGRGVAAERVGEADLGPVDLPTAGLAAQLGDDLHDLGSAGRADRVALGLEAAGGVDGHLAAQARPALFGGDSPRARLEQAETFRRHDLRDREAVVQ